MLGPPNDTFILIYHFSPVLEVVVGSEGVVVVLLTHSHIHTCVYYKILCYEALLMCM